MIAKTRYRKVTIISLLVCALFLSACGSDEETNKNAIRIALPSEPGCLDPIGDCTDGELWAQYSVVVNTLPRAFEAERVGETNVWEYEVSDLLASEPILEVEPKQKVTYSINEDAKWSDGTEITGEDFEYTWKEITEGEGVYDPTGYENISSVILDPNNEKSVTVEFDSVFAGWKQLFGGAYGLLPAHILDGEDRFESTKDGYTFSGGPFKLKEWDKGNSIILERNDNYWGEKAQVEEVEFTFISDSTSALKSFEVGEVDAIYPQPSDAIAEAISSDRLKGDTAIVNPATGNSEALWLNNAAAPFDSTEVRKALLLSVDRSAIVKALFGDFGIETPLNAFLPAVQSQYSDPTAFDQYATNVQEAEKLLNAQGYRKNSNGKYQKSNGELLEFKIITSAGEPNRQLMMEIIKDQLDDQGWTVEIDGLDDLFTPIDAGDFQAAIYSTVATSLNPDLCSAFCSKNIPSEENEFFGFNSTRTDIAEVDKLIESANSELDDEQRRIQYKEIEKLLADNAVSMPIVALPNVFIFGEKISGADENPIDGPFASLAEWKVKN